MQTFSLVCSGNPQIPRRKDMNLIHKVLLIHTHLFARTPHLFCKIIAPSRNNVFKSYWSIPSKNCQVFDRLGHVLNISKTFKVLKAIWQENLGRIEKSCEVLNLMKIWSCTRSFKLPVIQVVFQREHKNLYYKVTVAHFLILCLDWNDKLQSEKQVH